MGRGPKHLVDNGLQEWLRAGGHEVGTEVIEAGSWFPTEIATAFELHRLVADQVRQARERDELPLVLSGNCNTSAVGALAGLNPQELGIVWFDAHTDFDTPETTTSAFLDGMGLSIAVGACWKTMAETIPGFRPIPEANVTHIGTRGLDQPERERLERSGVTVVEAGLVEERGVQDALRGVLDALRDRVSGVYVHLDLDVLDSDLVAPANGFAKPGGLTTEQVVEALQIIRLRFVLAAAGIASYDPAYDEGGRVLHAGLELAEVLAAEAEG